MSAEQNKSIVYRWVTEAWNQGNFSSVQALYPASYLLHDVSSPVAVQGPQGLVQFIGVMRQAYPDLRMNVTQTAAEGELVAWSFHFVGTQTGELIGIPASGRKVEIDGMVFSRFEQGKWVEDYTNWDQLGMLRQIGAIPAPAGQ
jgi:steroid delta-isomerase-like uncharacterized protein